MNRTLIFSGGESLIYHESDETQEYIRKVLHAIAPDQEQIQRFHNEFEFTKDLSIPGVRGALRREKEDGQFAIILEYIEGSTLEEAFIGRGRPLIDIVDAFIMITDTLGRLHDAGIIHKDLTGRNILWDVRKTRPVIIDFGISSRLDYVSNNLGNPDRIKGTLTHMPPEQTGRVNRRIDSRSDLYSLGVTMYHLLSGSLPFVAEDSLELVHAHIARRPVPLHHINPDVPETLSQIVLKLLSKDAESRYQTAYGLKADLERCRNQLATSRMIAPFDLGTEDHTGKFQIPQKLYGRDTEVATLLKAFDRVSRGSTELVLVSGFSGVGKSALISELFKPVTERRGYFVSGKFDQYQRNIPYSAIIGALSEFCEQLLTEQEESLAVWRDSILEAVGTNGVVLTELIPALTYIIGDQQEVAKLESQEALNRFNLVFQNFIRCVARPEHPFVLFCDDLQWADSASLQLLRSLVTNDANPYLLVIGAYRNNEIQAGHQLMTMLDSARTEGAVMVEIDLAPLSERDLSELIEDTLHLDRSTTRELTDIVFSKTLGNAFFTLELLKSLNQHHCLRYDHLTKHWNVDLTAIRALEMSTNVVELLISKIAELPTETQRVLKMASCVGGLFDLSTLSHIGKVAATEVLRQLWPAVLEGLVVPLDDAFQYVGLEGIAEDQKVAFEFSHDRVQQAAYSLMQDAERAQMHLSIGRMMLADGADVHLFDIVNHLNHGADLVVDDQERHTLSTLNLRAAQQARDSGAYGSAHALITMSMRLTPESSWETDYDHVMLQARTAADIEYLNGNFDRSEELIHICLGRARSESERSEIYFMLMQNQSNSGRYPEAIESARQGLHLLDFTLPANNACAEHIPAEMGKIITWFTEHGVDAVFERPDMTDERSLAIINILDNLSPPAYVSGETNLWILHVLYKVNLTIEQGLSPQGGYAFSELGLIFFILGNYPFADPCAQMSMRIVEKFQSTSPRHVSRAGHLYTNYCTPWVKHISESARLNPGFYGLALECGELIYAGYTSFFPHYTAFYQGKDSLPTLQARLPDAIDFSGKIKHDLAHDSLKALNLVIMNLSGSTSSALSFDGNEYTEAELMAYCQQVQDYFAITIFNVYKAYALYIRGEIDAAMDAIQTALAFAAAMAGCAVIQTLFNYTHSLTLIARAHANPDMREDAIAVVEANQVQLKLWADHNEANFLHKYLLVEAELARLREDHDNASSLYHQAIASAEAHDFVREEALAHARSAAYWQSRHMSLYVQAHAERAIRMFESLGYTSVTNHLLEAFAEYVISGPRGTATLDRTIASRTSSRSLAPQALDVNSLVKTARALSESLEVDALMQRMLHIVIENAGAQRAVLLVQEFGAWSVRAEVDVDSGNGPIFHNERLENTTLVPISIVNYVVRTNSMALSSNSTVQRIAERDAYIASSHPASYLCLPLTHKGETNAIIYAEHRTGTDFISNDRVEVVNLLASLMAVAMENASLYKRQSDLIVASQRFVPADFIRALGHQNLLQVQLGDSINQEITVLFGDIRAYSAISESLNAEDNFRFINSYLALVGPVIRRNNGFINHYYGDGYMALFPRDPADALRATEEIARELEAYNQQRATHNWIPIRVGFGIHTGRVMMGIIGDGDRQDANVISDAVNTASRLEGMTKNFSATVFISQQTRERLKEPDQFQTRFIGRLRMMGKEEVTYVHELFSADAANVRAKKQQTLSAYNAALEDYYAQRFAEAAMKFKRIVDDFPEDHSSRRFLDLAAQYMIAGADADWDGVETLQVK